MIMWDASLFNTARQSRRAVESLGSFMHAAAARRPDRLVVASSHAYGALHMGYQLEANFDGAHGPRIGVLRGLQDTRWTIGTLETLEMLEAKDTRDTRDTRH